VSKINKQTADEMRWLRDRGGPLVENRCLGQTFQFACLPADKSQTTPWKKEAKNRVWIGPQIGQIAEKIVPAKLKSCISLFISCANGCDSEHQMANGD